MLYLIIGLVLFIGMHVAASFRSRAPGNIRDRLGLKYMGGFALISAIGLGLTIWGYGQARIDPNNMVFWTAPEWTRHIILSLMPFSLIFLVISQIPAGRIRQAVKHPMVLGVKIWAAAHLVYNGDLASVLLFGSFLGFAVISRIMAKKRGDLGSSAGREPKLAWDIVGVVVGLAVYAAFVMGVHTILIGVPATS